MCALPGPHQDVSCNNDRTAFLMNELIYMVKCMMDRSVTVSSLAAQENDESAWKIESPKKNPLVVLRFKREFSSVTGNTGVFVKTEPVDYESGDDRRSQTVESHRVPAILPRVEKPEAKLAKPDFDSTRQNPCEMEITPCKVEIDADAFSAVGEASVRNFAQPRDLDVENNFSGKFTSGSFSQLQDAIVPEPKFMPENARAPSNDETSRETSGEEREISAENSVRMEHRSTSDHETKLQAENVDFKHNTSVTGQQTKECPFKCVFCNRSFSQLGDLRGHEKIHTGEKPYRCSRCEKRFSLVENLRAHERAHAGMRPYQCLHCNRMFAQLGHLKSHLNIHAGEERPFTCACCDKECSLLSNLNVHEQFRTGRKPHQCPCCAKKLTQLARLKSDEQGRVGKLPHRCSHCSMEFSNVGNLKVHEKIHTNDKPYSCSHCKQKFAHAGHLRAHEKVHSQDRLYQCSECERKFAHLAQLNQHKKVHHEERPYQCLQCERTFTQKGHLIQHKRFTGHSST